MTNFIIILAQKPIQENFAFNCSNYGVGGLNIDDCRVKAEGEIIERSGEKIDTKCAKGYDRPNASMFKTKKSKERSGPAAPNGRWPTNIINQNTKSIMIQFPYTISKWGKSIKPIKTGFIFPDKDPYKGMIECNKFKGDQGSASRFFKSFTK